jgi:hypothetical protein
MIKLVLFLFFGMLSVYIGVITSEEVQSAKYSKAYSKVIIDNLRRDLDQERLLNDRLQQENEILRNHVLEVGRDLNVLEQMRHVLSPSCKKELTDLWHSR